MKRSELKRKKGLKKRSKRADDYEAELDAITPALLERSKGGCEICRDAPATHRHHRLRRSQGGKNTLANLLHLCDNCHRHVHDHPAESYRQGYLLRRGQSVSVASCEQGR